MKILTIVIPTFNRSKLLTKTLDSLSSQINTKIQNQVEVVISDNASPDNTGDKVKDWIDNNSQIDAAYFRNPENLGFDRNFLLGAEGARGQFIWFMSDDDFLAEGAVEKIVHVLEHNTDITFAFVNYSMLTPGFEEYFPYKYGENIKLAPDEFFIRSEVGFSFVSSCIFKREVFIGLDLEKYIGSFWIHLYAAKDAAIQGVCLIIAEPLLKMVRPGLHESRSERKDSSRTIEAFMDFHLSFLDYIDSFCCSSYSKDTVKFLKNLGWGLNFNQIVSFKLTSETYRYIEIKEIFLRMRKYFNNKYLFWFVHVPFLISPKFISAVYFYVKLKKIKLKLLLKPSFISLGLIK